MFLLINFSEHSDPQAPNRSNSNVLKHIENGIEVGNTRLAVATLAAHVAATQNISIAGERLDAQESIEHSSYNRIRHRHPPMPHGVI